MGRIESLSSDNLWKIATYFNVTVDYLIGKEAETPFQIGKRAADDSAIKLALFGGDGEVTDEMWEEAQIAAQIIKERHKRKKDSKSD